MLAVWLCKQHLCRKTTFSFYLVKSYSVQFYRSRFLKIIFGAFTFYHIVGHLKRQEVLMNMFTKEPFFVQTLDDQFKRRFLLVCFFAFQGETLKRCHVNRAQVLLRNPSHQINFHPQVLHACHK